MESYFLKVTSYNYSLPISKSTLLQLVLLVEKVTFRYFFVIFF